MFWYFYSFGLSFWSLCCLILVSLVIFYFFVKFYLFRPISIPLGICSKCGRKGKIQNLPTSSSDDQTADLGKEEHGKDLPTDGIIISERHQFVGFCGSCFKDDCLDQPRMRSMKYKRTKVKYQWKNSINVEKYKGGIVKDCPVGELMDLNVKNGYNLMKPKVNEKRLSDARKAAEIHRCVRSFIRQKIKPGERLYHIAEELEGFTRSLTGDEFGVAFPTGLNVNDCAAHWTPMPHSKRTLSAHDVLKVDFGVQINGAIIDSAFSVHFDPCWDPLVEATREATNVGIKNAGVDARLGELGKLMSEVLKSYEVIHLGKTYAVKPIQNLCGHSIGPYRIHDGQSIPIVESFSSKRMTEDTFYAIETFATTGFGYAFERTDPCNHFMLNYSDPSLLKAIPTDSDAAELLQQIKTRFSTLAFCQRYMLRWKDLKPNFDSSLSKLIQQKIIQKYPPLYDIRNSMTSQSEHTIFLGSRNKEVLSRGIDY